MLSFGRVTHSVHVSQSSIFLYTHSVRRDNVLFQCRHKYLASLSPHIVAESLESSSLLA